VVAALALMLSVVWRLHDKGGTLFSDGWRNSLSIFIPAVIIACASKATQQSSGKPAWQRLQWCTTQREKLEEEVKKLKAAIAPNPGTDRALLLPLQSDILRLVRDLRQMLQDAGPAPTPVFSIAKQGEDPWFRTQRQLVETETWQNEYSEWSRKLIYRYREEFSGRVRSLMNSLGLTHGMIVTPLEPYTADVRPGDDFTDLLKLLMGFFVKIEMLDKENKKA